MATIRVTARAGIGSLDLVLAFDPGRLSFREAGPGPAAGGAFLETGSPSPGTLRVGLLCPDGTAGEGGLISLVFDRADDRPSPPAVRLEKAEAWSAEADVRLRSDAASRKHALIELRDGAFIIRDLESMNGTWVNGREVQRATLRPDDVLQIGEGGPRLRIVSIETGAGSGRASRRPRRGKNAHRAQSHSEPGPSPSTARSRRLPVLAFLGALFGLAMCLPVWGGSHPLPEATAPAIWVLRATIEFAPDLAPQYGIWIFRLYLVTFWAGVGFALQRPIRRFRLLLFLGLAFAAALYFRTTL